MPDYYPHTYRRPDRGRWWYCRCGVAIGLNFRTDPTAYTSGANCLAAMRERIAELERERTEAQTLLRRALRDAVARLNDAGDDDMQVDDWFAGFEAAVAVLRQLVTSFDQGEA